MSARIDIGQFLLVLFGIIGTWFDAFPQEGIDYAVSMSAVTSSGCFAPYFIGSLNHGKTTQKDILQLDASVSKDIDDEKRFSWGFGAEALGGYASRNDYLKWSAQTEEWTVKSLGPSALSLQQAYVEMKYRSVYLMAGMKEHCSALMSPELSSGDFVESGNARPIPEIRAGLYDFVDIPFTNHWLQIQCQVAYGKMVDGGFMRDHYNYYSYHIARNALYNYKFCHFRTNPDQRFMATFGMQAAGVFGGEADYYKKGELIDSRTYSSDFKSFLEILIPVFNNDEDFALGSSLGAWDFFGQYSLDSGDELCAYFQWPFEDGSSIARRNKLDGVWGIEYRRAHPGIISNVVVEYVDFRDQSGPIHYAPDDMNHPSISSESTGRDDYYNNFYYNSYANYGMSIGTPFLKSPIYNLDGYPAFSANRANGFHVGIDGDLSGRIHYRAQVMHQRNFGAYNSPFHSMHTNTSSMLECRYLINNRLDIVAMLAYDKGRLFGNNFGAMISLRYKSSFSK